MENTGNKTNSDLQQEEKNKYGKALLFISGKSNEVSVAIALTEAGRSAFYFKKILLILGELFFYLNFVCLLILALLIPTDPIEAERQLGQGNYIHATLHDENVTAFMIALKIFCVFFSLLPLIIAILLGSMRRKRNRFNKIYEQLKQVKKGFDDFLKAETK